MSYCRQEGKDRIIFVTKEDHEAPSNAELVADDPNDPYEEQGLILPSGDINWNCPCLGGMASGPCGSQFKEAFSCFHYSTEEVKGSECIDNFRNMQECMQKYPELYPQEEDKESSTQAESDSSAASAAQTEGSASAAQTEGSASAAQTEGSASAAQTEGSSSAAQTEGSASAAQTEGSALSPETDATPSTSDPSADSASPTDSQTAS